MKWLLTLILVLLVTGTAVAGNGTQYSGVQTLELRDGLNGYDGTSATYITAAIADTNKNYGACSTLRVGGPLATEGESHILLRFDVGPAPDGCILTRAYWRLYQIGPDTSVAATASYESLSIHRLWREWDEGVGSCTGADHDTSADWSDRTALAWLSPGASNVFTGSASLHGRHLTGGTSSDSDSSTAGSVYGADTLFYNPPADDIVADKDASVMWRFGTTAVRRLGRIYINMTEYYQRVLSGAIKNNGHRISMMDSGSLHRLRFASDDYVDPASGDTRRRPTLFLEYADTTGLGQAGAVAVRRKIGG